MARVSRAFVVVLAIGCARPAPAPDGGARAVPPPRADGRLPRQVHPTRYALELVVDPAQPRFSGRARIAVVVDEPTSAIVLNARGLTVKARRADHAGRAVARRDGAAPRGRLQAGSGGAGARVRPDDPARPRRDRDRLRRRRSRAGLRGLYRVAGARSAGTRSRSSSRPTRGARSPASTSPATRRRSRSRSRCRRADGRGREHARGAPPPGRRALMRFEFEASPPLPTYLVALAVGAFDDARGAGGRRCRSVSSPPSGKAGLGAAALAAARGAARRAGALLRAPLPVRASWTCSRSRASAPARWRTPA